MGYEFKKADEVNPDGFWEDIEFASPNWRFLNGKITYPEWIEMIFATIANRKSTNQPWGFKDPDASHFLGLYFSFFEKPKIIRCQRKKELVVKSLVKKLNHTKEHAENIWYMKEMILDNLLQDKDYLTIRFNERRISDNEIMQLIEGKYATYNYQMERT